MNPLHQSIENEQELSKLDSFIQQIEAKIIEVGEKLNEKSVLSHQKIVIEQYRICVGFLSDFFTFIPSLDWEIDGVGSCGISEVHSEGGIDGPFAQEILQLREKKKSPKEQLSNACTFHKRKVGCILGDLKSPLCVTYSEGELPNSYDEEEFRELLSRIQLGGGNSQNWYKDTNPTQNWTLVLTFLKKVRNLSLELKKNYKHN